MAGAPLDKIRVRMARAVIERVAGNEPPPRRSSAPVTDPWVAFDSPVRQVHGDVAMLIGGLRALLLQSLHPVAMLAVAEHSGFRTDPWRRLRRTAAFVGATTFGSVADADASIELVRRIHRGVTGVTADGDPYRASDPRLLLWVHVAELDSFLTAYRAYGRTTLTPAEADRYVADMTRTAGALGVVDPPQSVAELASTLAGFRPELRGGGPATDAAQVLLRDPQLSGAVRAGYAVISAGAVATLPAWARSELGLPVLPIVDRTLLRPAARTLLHTLDRGFAAAGLQRPSVA